MYTRLMCYLLTRSDSRGTGTRTAASNTVLVPVLEKGLIG